MKRIAALGLVVVGLAGCGGPPSMGEDKEVFKAVDALYTAVSLRDPNLVGRCEAGLTKLRDAGKLPKDAASTLEAIIAEAKAGTWEPAQERLSKFMEGQRR